MVTGCSVILFYGDMTLQFIKLYAACAAYPEKIIDAAVGATIHDLITSLLGKPGLTVTFAEVF